MSEPFDPYYTWLGIPPDEQPPNHYRLLGVPLFEPNGDVISNAADRQMGHLRTFQTGKREGLSQRLLNEVAAAKVCLLNAAKKVAYDEALRTQLPPTLVAAPQPEWNNLFDASLPPPGTSSTAARRKRTAGNRTLAAAALAGGLLLLGAVLWIVYNGVMGNPAESFGGRQRQASVEPLPKDEPSARKEPSRPAPTKASTHQAPKPEVALRKPPKPASTSVAPRLQVVREKEPADSLRPLPEPAVAKEASPRVGPVSVRTDESASVDGDLRVQYKCGERSTHANQIRMSLRIVNHGSETVPVSELKLRYWYTIDGDRPQQYWCDWAEIGASDVKASFHGLARPTRSADAFLEITFPASAKSIGPNGKGIEFQNRVAKSDWSNYDLSNDYSFDPAKTEFTDWPRVTLYRNGKLIWGAEPIGRGDDRQ